MFSKKEIIEILKNPSGEEIFTLADEVRKKNVGEEIHLRALIEFSNVCKNSCSYCGLRIQNCDVSRYKMSADEIIQCAKNAVDIGYKTIVLQSGESSVFKKEEFCEIIKEIKKLDVALTLSIGEKTRQEYKAFKDAGADRFLLRIETTDEKLYEKMHPNMDFKNRIRCLYDLKELGYELGTGSLVGLPNQSFESLADDILFFQKIGADMIGVGPFISHNKTPLKDAPNGDFELSLKVMALCRILMKNINIPATTAMETISPNGRLRALGAGANVVMLNVTPKNFCENYQIYPDKNSKTSDILSQRKEIEEKINSIGRNISKHYGFRNKNS